MAKLFNVSKPKGFKITPRYWDPEKEIREDRERRMKAELGIKDEEGKSYTPYIRKGSFRQGISKGRWGFGTPQRKSNTRLLIIVAILALLIYFILK